MDTLKASYILFEISSYHTPGRCGEVGIVWVDLGLLRRVNHDVHTANILS